MGVDMHWATRSAKVGLRSIVEFVWPSRSIVSGERHGGAGALPATEFSNLQFLVGSGCRSCGVPMDVDLGEASLCGACAAEPKAWDQARAAIAYDDVSKRIILDLKHAGRRDGLATITNWMAMAGQDILQQTDWLIPVPLHYQRLAKRGFNQSVWLAQGVARHSHNLVLVDGLKRTRPTPSQGGLTAKQRRDNVKGAFSVRPSRAPRLKGATVTLVDDVYTTGSTLSACAKTLKQAGASTVNILVLARVVREADITI